MQFCEYCCAEDDSCEKNEYGFCGNWKELVRMREDWGEDGYVSDGVYFYYPKGYEEWYSKYRRRPKKFKKLTSP